MVWGRAGSATLTASGTDLSVTSITNSKTGLVIGSHSSGGTAIKLNGENGTNGSGNYAVRREVNGGGDSTNISRNGDNAYITDTRANPHFNVTYFVNVSDKEKLWINNNVHQNSSGNNAPQSEVGVGKWANTSDAVSQFDYHCWNGTYLSGDSIDVLNSDVTPAAGIPALGANVQVGSRYEETDTRKMYSLNDTSKSKLKAYYHFEDNGTNAQTTGDGFGSNADMTVTGATYITGKVGSKAISFDGTNDYTVIGLPSASSFNFLANTTHEWTVAFWLKNDDFSSLGMILSTAVELGSSRYGLGIRAQSNGSIYVHFCNGTNTNRFTTTQSGFSTDGNWHFIVITAKKSDSTNSLEFWQDGTSLGTASNSGKDFVDTNASQAPYIGQAGDSSQYLDGALDELSIWNRRLTDSEISTLYNSGTGQVIADGMSVSWEEIGA